MDAVAPGGEIITTEFAEIFDLLPTIAKGSAPAGPAPIMCVAMVIKPALSGGDYGGRKLSFFFFLPEELTGMMQEIVSLMLC